MLVRYSTSEKGKLQKRALVYTLDEHGIKRSDVDPDAVRITDRLRSAGFTAYIVGGAVRDLLLGKTPKDFDVVTDARPRTIKKVFRNSRIIGKRFRLVHVYFGPKIIEVSTFRSLDAEANSFGTLEEDVLRRDFRMNALYYCPKEQAVIDYVGGFKDIQCKRVKQLIPLKSIFTEDPVRMIRAIKYSATTGFKLPFTMRMRIRQCVNGLASISPSRITEELFKILGSGASADIFRLTLKYGMLRHILPELHRIMTGPGGEEFKQRFFSRMSMLDERVRKFGDIKRGRMLSYLFQDYLIDRGLVNSGKSHDQGLNGEVIHEAFKEVKDLLRPLVPPNREVENGVRFLLQKKRKRGSYRSKKPGSRKPRSGRTSGSGHHHSPQAK